MWILTISLNAIADGVSVTSLRKMEKPTFRELESEAVRKVSKLYNYVISTGGGVVLKEANMVELKRNGIVFCLTATAEEIYQRVRHQSTPTTTSNPRSAHKD